MANTTTIQKGMPCWIDLWCPDAQKGKEFYSKVFNWTTETESAPEMQGYTVFKLDGKSVGGIMQTADSPPAWCMFVCSDNCEATAKACEQAGGKVLMQPMQVMDHGSFCICQDPTGAVFGVWQPGKQIGAEILNVPGAMCWNDLATRDLDTAKDFYPRVFSNWTLGEQDMGGGTIYTVINTDAGSGKAGGMMTMPESAPAEAPSMWQTWFAVNNCDATCETIKQCGGTIVNGPMDWGQGRAAICTDNQGSLFAIRELY